MYCKRPQRGTFSALKNHCFAEFAAWYTRQTADEKYYQPNQKN